MISFDDISECKIHGYFATHLGTCPSCHTIASNPAKAPVIAITKIKQKGNKVEFEGHVFDSQTEYKRYLVLAARLTDGLITNLEVHPSFELLAKIPKIQSAITYTADFAYWYEERYIVEDSKGIYGNSERNRKRGIAGKAIVTPESRLRHKMLQFLLFQKYGDMFSFKIITNVYE